MRAILLMVLLVLSSCAAAEAQAVASFPDLWMRLKSGDRIFVTDGGGQETTGVFAKVSDSTISVLVDGQVREMASTEVREIARQGDSLWNGFLIGAGIGAALEVAAVSGCDEIYVECLNPAAAAAVGGLVFGGAGALIDHFIKGRTVVFRVSRTALRLRPAMTIDRGRVRASVVLSGR